MVIFPGFGNESIDRWIIFMGLCLTVQKVLIFLGVLWYIYKLFLKKNLVNVALAIFILSFLPFGLYPWSNFLLKTIRNWKKPALTCFPVVNLHHLPLQMLKVFLVIVDNFNLQLSFIRQPLMTNTFHRLVVPSPLWIFLILWACSNFIVP